MRYILKNINEFSSISFIPKMVENKLKAYIYVEYTDSKLDDFCFFEYVLPDNKFSINNNGFSKEDLTKYISFIKENQNDIMNKCENIYKKEYLCQQS